MRTENGQHINTKADMLNAAAEAGEKRDVDTLQELWDINAAWLQDEHEKAAMERVLELLQEMVLDLESEGA